MERVLTFFMLNTFLKYLQYEKRYSKHTLISYKTDLEQFENYTATEYELSDLANAEHRHIRAWVVHLMSEEVSATSINRKIAALRTFYKFCLSRDVIKQNPTLKIQTLKTPKKIPQFVQEASLDELLNNFDFDNCFEDSRDALILEMLYGTGVRLSELINTRHSSINTYKAQLKVLGKGNKERIIPLHKKLIDRITQYNFHKKELFGYNDHDILLVTNTGKTAYPVMIYRVVKKYLDLFTTIDKRSPHVLRHSFATHLLNKGADLNAVKDLLGHNSLAATQVYTHNSLDKLKSVFDQAHPKA